MERKRLEPESVPLVRDLGLDEDFVRALESLDMVERPFAKFNCSEEEVVDIVEELMRKGVGRDFSGVLRERKVGFKENGMTVLRLSTKPEKVAMKLLKNSRRSHTSSRGLLTRSGTIRFTSWFMQ